MPFQHVICPSLTPLGCQARQVPAAINARSDTDVARFRGRLLRDLRAQGALLLPGYFPDSVVTALSLSQYAAVGFYPTHVLHGSDEGGFCAMRKMVAYRH